MIYYFYSAVPAHIKINGIYEGQVSENLTSFETENKSLFEFLPIDENFFPCYVCENMGNCKIIPFDKGKLIVPYFTKKRNGRYGVISQKKFSVNGLETLLTVLSDGACKFYLQGIDSATEELPFTPKNVETEFREGFLYLAFTDKKTALYVYKIEEKFVLCYKNIIDSFSYNGNLSTVCVRENITKITETAIWKSGEPFSLESINYIREKNIYTLSEKILPYAFFEEVLLNSNFSDYLSPSIREHAQELKNFLGNFNAVITPPENEQGKICLLYENYIKFAEIEIENKSIINVKLNDY